MEAEVGPLTVLVESLDGAPRPAVGRRGRGVAVPGVGSRTTGLEALAGPAYKGFAHAEHLTADELLAVARRVVPADLATVTQAGLGYVEFTAPGVDKGTGLAVVAEELGVGPADVLVFGDMPNDVPMFRWAGWRRVAVANAHPEVLAVADEVTASNDADGVAAWLETLPL